MTKHFEGKYEIRLKLSTASRAQNEDFSTLTHPKYKQLIKTQIGIQRTAPSLTDKNKLLFWLLVH